jgi:hypothetical protein
MKMFPIVIALAVAFAPEIRSEETATGEAPSPAAAAPVLQAEDTAAMESKVGMEVIVEGVVRNVGKGPNEGITFLNFGDRRSGFVVVVFRPAYDKFPDGFDKYAQQKVRVRGLLEKYRDQQMQMKLFTADQIEIVESGPTD